MTTVTETAHSAYKRFTSIDLRHARKAYGRVLTDQAGEAEVLRATIVATLQTSHRSSSVWQRAYYDALLDQASPETRTLAGQAFADSLAEADARRAAMSERYSETPEDAEDD